MKLYIDDREHDLYNRLANKHPIHKMELPLGDIVLKTNDDIECIIIERKTIADLLSSIKDGRYKEQSHRLTHSTSINHHRIIYLIEGMFSGHSAGEKQLVYSSIVSLNQIKGFSVMRTWSVDETADVVLNLADKLQREMDKGHFLVESVPSSSSSSSAPPEYCNVVKRVKKDNITPENMGEIVLCQIPGISTVNAVAIMKKFTSISHMVETIKSQPDFLTQMTVETNGKQKKLNKNIVENIHKYILGGTQL
jgi:ERCC4-type nuclease